MLIAIGLDSDPTLAHFVRAAAAQGADIDLLNLRAAVDGDWELAPGARRPARFSFGDRDFELPRDAPVYCRLIDLSQQQAERADGQRWRSLIAGLAAWLEQAAGTVVNRPGHAADNGAKPLHESWLRAAGFRVAATLTSSSGPHLAKFAAAGPTIAKSVAGVRADTRLVTPDTFAGFEPASGPVHLQRRIEGRDLRLHVIDDVVHGELIESEAVDYRTANARFAAFEPPAALAASVVAATRAAGLLFAGWDFKIDNQGRFWCLEANPMPGYDGYDRCAGGAISRTLVERLTFPRP